MLIIVDLTEGSDKMIKRVNFNLSDHRQLQRSTFNISLALLIFLWTLTGNANASNE